MSFVGGGRRVEDRDGRTASGRPAWSLRGPLQRTAQAGHRFANRLSWSATTAWFDGQLETEAAARSAFFLIPVGLMIGICGVYGIGLRCPIWLAVLLAASASMLAWLSSGKRFVGTAAFATAFILCGSALATIELARTVTTTFSGEATVRIEGRVAWRDRDERGRMRYLVDIDGTERPVLSRPPGRAQILVSSRHEPLQVGERYRGLVRIRAPSGPAYPGGYDFAFGTFFKGLGAYGFGLGPPQPRDQGPDVRLSWTETVVTLRLAISDRIRAVIGGPEGAVAAALITGERAGIPDDVNEWLRSTGLSHVLSISGLHMTLVAGFAMLLVRAILALIPAAALMLPTKKIAATAALIVAAGYLLISGNDVATQRSFIMLSILLLAVLFDRPALTLRNVGMAAIVVLVISPHAVVTASFQMSFAATAALVGVYGGYVRWREKRPGASRPKGWLMAGLIFFGGLAVSSLLAGAATAPYAAFHFQRIAPFGLFANMLALPLFSFWIMPLALLSALLMPFGLDAPLLQALGLGLTLVFHIARALHAVVPDSPTGLMTTLGLILLTIALLTFCLLASRLRWLAIPLAFLGLALAPSRLPSPELLIFEDG